MATENLGPAPTGWDEYVQGVARWLVENWGAKKACPYCGSTEWQIGAVRRLPPAPNWPLEEDGELGFIPAIPITSYKCGQIVFVNALWIFEPQEVRIFAEEEASAENWLSDG